MSSLHTSWLFSRASLLMALFAAFIGFLFFRGIDLTVFSPKWKVPSGMEVLRKALAPVPPGGAPAADLVPDVGKEGFAGYCEGLECRAPVRLTIVDTTSEVAVEARAGTAPGTGEFVVVPRGRFTFRSLGIEAAVRDGLVGVPVDDAAAPPPRWSGWDIATNATEGAWTVQLRGLSGAGSVRLDIGTASALLPIALPRLFPIWRQVKYIDGRNGVADVKGREMRVGDMIEPADGVCGFRILAVTGRNVWFEVVNTAPCPAIRRKEWPEIRGIEWQELTGRPSRIRFDGGDSMSVGEKAVFDDGDALRLDADAFLSEHAVRFRYLDRAGLLLSDLIVVTLSN